MQPPEIIEKLAKFEGSPREKNKKKSKLIPIVQREKQKNTKI